MAAINIPHEVQTCESYLLSIVSALNFSLTPTFAFRRKPRLFAQQARNEAMILAVGAKLTRNIKETTVGIPKKKPVDKKPAKKKAVAKKRIALPRKTVKPVKVASTSTSSTVSITTVRVTPVTKVSSTSITPGTKVSYKSEKK